MELSVKEEVKKRMNEEYEKLSQHVFELLNEKIELNMEEHINFLHVMNLPIVNKLQHKCSQLEQDKKELILQKNQLLNKVRTLHNELESYKKINKVNQVTLEIKEIEKDLNGQIQQVEQLNGQCEIKNVLIESDNNLNNLNSFYSILNENDESEYSIDDTDDDVEAIPFDYNLLHNISDIPLFTG